MSASITRIGIIYDGNFFFHVSNYYTYYHETRRRLSLRGLHNFIRQEIARREDTPYEFCQLVDLHYFRGRRAESEVDDRTLRNERRFDEVLLREGVTAHYMPIGNGIDRGVDVWLALETLETARLKNYDVCVLIASDGDFLPLVRKLYSLGTRVMILGWDFRYEDNGRQYETRTSKLLLEEATHTVMMSDAIDDPTTDTEEIFI